MPDARHGARYRFTIRTSAVLLLVRLTLLSLHVLRLNRVCGAWGVGRGVRGARLYIPLGSCTLMNSCGWQALHLSMLTYLLGVCHRRLPDEESFSLTSHIKNTERVLREVRTLALQMMA